LKPLCLFFQDCPFFYLPRSPVFRSSFLRDLAQLNAHLFSSLVVNFFPPPRDICLSLLRFVLILLARGPRGLLNDSPPSRVAFDVLIVYDIFLQCFRILMASKPVGGSFPRHLRVTAVKEVQPTPFFPPFSRTFSPFFHLSNGASFAIFCEPLCDFFFSFVGINESFHHLTSVSDIASRRSFLSRVAMLNRSSLSQYVRNCAHLDFVGFGCS